MRIQRTGHTGFRPIFYCMVQDTVLSRLMHTVKDTISFGDYVFLLNAPDAGSRTYSFRGLCGLGLHPSLSSPTRHTYLPTFVLLTIFTVVRVFALSFTVSMGRDIVLSVLLLKRPSIL